MRYLLKKILFFIITAWVAITINFVLPRMMPGDPATVLLVKFPNLPPEALEAIKLTFGLVTVPKKISVASFNKKVIDKLNEKKEAIMKKSEDYWTKMEGDLEVKNIEDMTEVAIIEKKEKEQRRVEYMKKIELQLNQVEEEKTLILRNYFKNKRGRYYVLNQNITSGERSRITAVFSSIKYKQSMFIQYISYLKRIITGDFGYSTSKYPSKVSEVLKFAIPWTLGLMGISIIISFTLGTMLGVVNAWKRLAVTSSMVLIGSLFIKSLPEFWLAVLLRYLFGFILEWFPLYGAYEDVAIGIQKFSSILYHGVLPALTIITVQVGGFILMMRNNMIGVLSDNYVSFARAKGIPDRVIKYKYAARNAILPSVTGFAMTFGMIMAGTMLVEMVFSYPGIGFTMFNSIISLDYSLMQACSFLITMGVLIANFIADLCYVLLDPRVRTGGDGNE